MKKNNKQQQHLFNIHPSGNLIQRCYKIPFPDVKPNELNAVWSEEKIVYNVAKYVFSRDFLPMPVQMSPVLLYMIPFKEWNPRYADSIESITLMRKIIETYAYVGLTYYDKNKKTIENAKKIFANNIKVLENDVYTKLNELYVNFRDKKYNEKHALEKFLEIMEKATVDRINHMERLLLQMFKKNDEEPRFYTPHEYPAGSILTKVLANYFNQKQHIRNERMKNETAVYTEDICYFDVENMEKRFQTTPKDQIFKGYIDRATLWEYFKFMDVDEILK